MKLVIYVISFVALRLADALQVAPQWNAQSWFEIQKPLHSNVERESETKRLLGVEDGHELGDVHADHLSAWNEFKKTFKREFSSFEEEVARFKIFVENMLFVNAHNQLYREGKSSYELGINEFADMSNKEFVASKNGMRLQVKPSAMKRRRPLLYRTQSRVTDLPDSVDWRTKGYVTPVKNQAHCGSCWSFSTTGALEGQWFAKTGQLISLSEQQLVDCSKKWGNNGCDGGLMDNAFTYIKAVGGIESESEYPYTAEDGKCKFQKSELVANDTGYIDVEQGSEAALLQAVATVGPVSVAIDASHMSFQTYKQGIYDEPSCSSTDLDHGVLVVGYGQDSSGGKYWIVKNSWGPGWGEQGYIRMARDKDNMCGIASSASYPTV